MPHLRFRALDNSHVARLSETLPRTLAAVVQTPEDNFTLEKIATEFYWQGQGVPGTPFVEVLWFARSQEVQDKVAQVLTAEIKKLTGPVDVTVVFQVLATESYYENGEHF